MLAGAGELLALDSRATNPSVLSGILQSSSYIAGLSGGSWLVGSLASNDLIPVDQLLREDKLWDIQNSLVAYYGVNIVRNTAMWGNINLQVQTKQLAGFTVSITDVYGRALSHQLLTNFDNQGLHFMVRCN